MDCLTFAVELTKALAWPVLIAGCAFGFRRHVTTLVAATSRVLRQARRVNAWGLEVEAATEAVVTSKVSEVADIGQRLASDDLQPAEREALKTRLRAASDEVERLNGVLLKLQSIRSSLLSGDARALLDGVALYKGDISPGRKLILRRMAATIGADKIIELSQKAESYKALYDAFNRLAQEVGQNQHLDRGLNGSARFALQSVGVLDRSGAPTDLGVFELIKAAHEVAGGAN